MTSSPEEHAADATAGPEGPPGERSPLSTTPARVKRRWSRRLMQLVLVALFAVAVFVGLGVLALGSLHHPRIKPHVVAAALEYGGVVLDFRVLEVSLMSGTVHAEGLSLPQPARFAGHAPTWLTAGSLDARLDTGALLDGRVHVHDLTVADVTLDIVRDAQGTTLDLLFPSDPDAAVSPLELSKARDLLRGLGVEADQVSLSVARASLTEVDGAELISQATVTDLALSGHLHEQGDELDVSLALRSPEGARAGIALLQTVSRARDASGAPTREGFDVRSELELDAGLDVQQGAQLRVTLQAWPDAQAALALATTAPLRAELLLGLAFHEDDARTEVELRVPSVLGGLAEGHVTGELRDDSPTTLRNANGRVDAHFDQLPFSLPGVSASGFRASLVLADATVGAEGLAGSVALEAALAEGALEEQSPSGHVSDARLSLTTRAASTAVFNGYVLELDAGHLDYRDGDGTSAAGGTFADGDGLVLRLTGPTLDTAWAEGAAGAAQAGGAPLADAVAASDVLTVALSRLDLGMDAHQVTLTAPQLRADGVGLLRAALTGAALRGDVQLDAEVLEARAGRDRVSATPLHARAALHGLELAGSGLFGLGGALDVSVDANARFSTGGMSGDARGLAPRLHVDLDSGGVHGDVALGSLATRERGETTLALRSVALAVRGSDLGGLAPPRARGLLHLEGRVGHVATADAAASLPRVSVDVRGTGGAYAATLSGRIAGLESGGETYAGTHPVRATLNADLRAHVYDVEARLGASARDERSVEAPDVGDVDDASAANTPDLRVALHAALSSDGERVEHRIEGSARHLAALLRPYFAPGTDLNFDALHVEGSGALADALTGPARSGQFLPLAVDLARALRGEQQLRLTMDALRYLSPDGLLVTAPTATLDAQARQREGVTEVTVAARLPLTNVVDGRSTADLSDLNATLGVSLADLDDPSTASLTLDVRVRHAGQTFVAGYPIANVHLVAAAETTPVSMTLTSLTLENPAGRTRLDLQGAYEGALQEVRAGRQAHAEAAIYGREALALTGTLEQDLAAFSGTSFAQRASGTLQVPLRIESGDLSTFRVSARLVAHDASFVAVTSGVVIEGLQGDVPIEQVITLTPSGRPTIQATPRGNPLSRSRFPDVQPFLDRDAFLSAQRIIIADQVLGPLAGNLRIEGTTFALDRLQFGFRSGVVTAQLEADIRRGAAYMTMRGNATGVQGRQTQDILDANFALRFAPETLALDGSVQLVRMSRSHLEAFMDVVDPYREDTNMNTVRALLPFGHPRTLQARVQDGLMDLDLQLGGIAGVASIQGIRAIPIAPLLDDYVAPVVDRLFREPEGEARVPDSDSEAEGPHADE